MKKQAIFIFGTPGSGKGTQANLLEWTSDYIHFDSGRFLRSVLYNDANKGKKLIERERKLNEAGILNAPSWVLGIFKKEVEKIAKAGESIVYSGSPRTMYEAFGDKKNIGLVPFLEKLYGKKNIYAIVLNLNPEIAAARNKIRRTCVLCHNPVLGDAKLERCTLCLGELKVRIDDDPEKYKVRYNEYMTRTLPILNELRKKGYTVKEIDASRQPPEIHSEIKKYIGIF